MVREEFSRNIGPLTEKEQEKLEGAKVGIIGVGGVGSPAFEMLVRAGIRKFVVFDWDRFEKSNFNRQIYATVKSEGKPKTIEAKKKAGEINPEVEVAAFTEMLNSSSAGKLAGCDIVIDGTDNLPTRKIVAAFCRKNKIPYVFASAGGSRGMVGIFTKADFEKTFRHAKDAGCAKKGIIGVAAVLSGTLAAAQAICALLGKKTVEAPEFLFFDVFSERAFWKAKI